MAYFSNGAEGFKLEQQCSECRLRSDAPCPVLFVQTEFNYEQCNNEGLHNALGYLVDQMGVCQMKPLLENVTPKCEKLTSEEENRLISLISDILDASKHYLGQAKKAEDETPWQAELAKHAEKLYGQAELLRKIANLL